MKLAPPTILSTKITEKSIDVHIQLAERDMHSKKYGWSGFVESSVSTYGARYKVEISQNQVSNG